MATAVMCSCGRCRYWVVLPHACVQGVLFTEGEAKAVARMLNLMETPKGKVVALQALSDAEFEMDNS